MTKAGILCSLIFVMLLFSCQHTNKQKKGKVYIDKQNGRYTLYRNGQTYFIKGAAGFTHLKLLAQAGGNTIKLYDTVNLKTILDSAYSNHLAVIVGIPLPESRYADYFYNNPEKITAQYNRVRNTIRRYRSHPALLMWCLGNELQFGFKPKYLKFYSAFNSLVDMVHTEDPDHPVTTSVVNFDANAMMNISHRTDVDVISINVFGPIRYVKHNLDKYSWMWSGPFIISEWGTSGPWESHTKTNWDAAIEPTSTKKAEQYAEIYHDFMPVSDPRFLGSFVFYWGQKQEVTPTWFSLFSEDGYAAGSVGAMEKIWGGKIRQHPAAQLKYMLVGNKGANDNIILTPGAVSNARVIMADTVVKKLTIKWEILPEDWVMDDYRRNTNNLRPLSGLITSASGLQVNFKVPATEGPYRIYAYIYDSYGNYATCNTPFYVVK